MIMVMVLTLMTMMMVLMMMLMTSLMMMTIVIGRSCNANSKTSLTKLDPDRLDSGLNGIGAAESRNPWFRHLHTWRLALPHGRRICR